MKTLLSILFYLLLAVFAQTQSLTSTGCINRSKPKYVLPFPAGQSFLLLQGNCGKHSHVGNDAFSYDFRMPIGTYVIAMRDGKVVNLKEENRNGTNTNDSLNFIIILHDDSTASRYLHLTQNGALVEKGQYVYAGDTIAISGDSGLSTEPHLHVDVTGYCTKAPCQTIPFTFKNARDKVPIQGRIYEALKD